MTLASPWWLILLVALPVQIYGYARGGSGAGGIFRFPGTRAARAVSGGDRARFRHVVFALALLAEATLIVAMARPRIVHAEERQTSEGVDIVLVLDVSGSMQALDLGGRERLDVAKDVVRTFVDARKTDRLGMVVFAAESYTQCPLTLDYDILRTLLAAVSIRMNGTIPDGTAIGMAIATGTNRLRRSVAQSKVMILLTDGSNNAGIIDPHTAAQAAARVGVKIYTIGVGARGRAPIRVDDPLFGSRIDYIDDALNEDILREVAANTGGQFFRATSKQALEHIYYEIGQMETTGVESFHIARYTELVFTWELIPVGIALVVLGFALGQTIFRTLP